MVETDEYNSKAARKARAATINVKTMIEEFGDPNGGLGYVDPYEGPLLTSSVVYKAPPVRIKEVNTFPSFMPDITRRMARSNNSSVQQ